MVDRNADALADRPIVLPSAVTRATDIVYNIQTSVVVEDGRARQLIFTGFPYDLVYIVHGDVVSILAVAHHHRRPGYWRERLNG